MSDREAAWFALHDALSAGLARRTATRDVFRDWSIRRSGSARLVAVMIGPGRGVAPSIDRSY